MKLLLSSSYYLNRHPNMQRQPHLYPPLGLLYLAAYIDRATSWDIEIYDSTFAQDVSEFAAKLDKSCPTVVGIQSTITTRIVAKSMIEIAKKMGTTVIAGGADPTVSYSDYLRWGADFVVIGEGEITALELLTHLANNNLYAARMTRGIAWVDGANVVVNSPQPLIKDLNELPYPAYNLINLDPYFELWRRHHGHTELHLLTSRGCPFTCTWCSRAVFGQSFRQRSVYSVVQEMSYLRSAYGIEQLWIADDTFGLNKQWLEAWCDEVINRNLQLPFKCMTRIDLINQEMIQKLKTAGCYLINLGVETGSQKILNAMKKRTQISQIRSASRIIQNADIGLGYFIMFGYPGETFSDIRQTERLLSEVNPDNIGYSVAYPVPGTEFYESVKDQLVSTNRDVLWERTMERLQLMFRAEYPLIYYQALIRYLENRQRYLQMRGVSKIKLICLVNIIMASGLRWIIEFWILITKMISSKGKGVYCNEF